jgi:hypothetical protein
VLRGSGLQIVDSHGRIRASIMCWRAATRPTSERRNRAATAITERGRPTVKIAASEPASGLSFAGPTGTKDSYVILQTKGTRSSLKLRNEGGGEQVVEPQ